VTEQKDTKSKILPFVNPDKSPTHYVKRYLKEPKYKEWFDRNYPDYTIYEGIGITKDEYEKIAQEVADVEFEKIESELSKSSEQVTSESPEIITDEDSKTDTQIQTLLDTVSEAESSSGSESRMSFDQFVDERLLVSHDAFGNKQMKIKVLEVSDEHPPVQWKFGDRVKVNKILVTIKHLDTQEVEEGEFDIEAIERELAEKRHYTSTNRWIPSNEIKNGYVVGSRHTSLISDALALDYIVF